MADKILVVDHCETDLVLIKRALAEFSVLTARDGKHALSQINKDADICIVLLASNMPKGEAFQIIDTLSVQKQNFEIGTILLIDSNDRDDEIRGYEKGAIDSIFKPLHEDILLAKIKAHVEFFRMKKRYGRNYQDQGLTFEAIFKAAPIGIAISYHPEPVSDTAGSMTKINPALERILDRSQKELIEKGWAAITLPDDLKENITCYRKFEAGLISSYTMDKRYFKPDGSIVWVHMVVAPLSSRQSGKKETIALFQDITERKDAETAREESERSKAVLLSHLPGLAYRCNFDSKWTMQYVSDGCYDLTGYPSASIVGNKALSFKELIAPQYHEELKAKWDQSVAHHQDFKGEYEIITAAGKRRWVLEMGQAVYDDGGQVEALEGLILDISDRKEIENALTYNYQHDRWTGLYNREYLEKLLQSDAKKQATAQKAVVEINLSSVHSLTLTYGFHYTQDLIRKVVRKLSEHCSQNRQLFNTYEYRFVFYLKNYRNSRALRAFCDRIVSSLEPILTPERVGGGIAVVTLKQGPELDVDELFKNLLIASEEVMSAQNSGFGICFHDAELEAKINREQTIKKELYEIAVGEQDGSLYMQFQPILNLKTNRICGFEALARLKSAKLGWVAPLDFIPLAEETKLIVPIGKKIIRQAFRFLNRLQELGHDDINVSINISVIQLLAEDFFDSLMATMAVMKINPTHVGLEITESVFASNFDEINVILRSLKDAGVNILLDDFGTGYSSLARERELNINCLKIDRSFVSEIMHVSPEKSIMGDIVSMAHKLGHGVVAEGVEYEKQRQYLIDCDCDKLQGYLISKPLDAKDALKLV